MALKLNSAKTNNSEDAHPYPHGDRHGARRTRAHVPQIPLTK